MGEDRDKELPLACDYGLDKPAVLNEMIRESRTAEQSRSVEYSDSGKVREGGGRRENSTDSQQRDGLSYRLAS